MGYVRVKALIGREEGSVREVELLADSGALRTTIGSRLAEELGLQTVAKRRVRLADNREVEARLAYAYVKIMDREEYTWVYVLPETPEPLLGVSTLEELGLKIDPVTGRLEYSRPYGAAIL